MAFSTGGGVKRFVFIKPKTFTFRRPMSLTALQLAPERPSPIIHQSETYMDHTTDSSIGLDLSNKSNKDSPEKSSISIKKQPNNMYGDGPHDDVDDGNEITKGDDAHIKKEPGYVEDINGNSYDGSLAVSMEQDLSPTAESFSPGEAKYSVDANGDVSGNEFSPTVDADGIQIIEVDCGANRAVLYLDKLCQGSKGKCILFQNDWYTPNEFQAISGRVTAKDWKRSIRHRGKSLKILMARGLLQAHPMMCDCNTCKNNMCRNNFSYIVDAKPKKSSWTNGSAVKSKKFRSHFDDMAVDHYMDYSMKKTTIKRARSASPTDDIYDEQQRKIFQAANSPEPQNIENMQRSFNMDGHSSTPDSPQGARLNVDPSPASASPVPSPSGVLLAMHPQMMISKSQVKHRKQTAPQHVLIPTSEVQETTRVPVPHIQLMPVPTHSSKAQASIRPRYHQTSRSVTIPPGPSSTGVLEMGGSIARRARSLMTPSSKSPLFNPMRMIELTRPSSNKTETSTPSPVNGHESFSRNPTPSTTESVFLSSDMSNWNVEDVVDFVQGLKGCEEYGQVFRDQAIDGEILPILTEEHLLTTMGLKLGPALKIRLNIARKLGYFMDGQYHVPKPENPFDELQ